MKKEELLQSLSAVGDIGPLRNGLDDGYLVLSQATLYFIAEKMGTWSVLQEWPRSSISKVQGKEGFLGKELTFQSNGRTVTFKKIPMEFDAVSFVQGQGSVVNQSSTTTSPEPAVQEVEPMLSEQSSMEITFKPVSVEIESPEPEDVSVSSSEDSPPKFKTLKDRMIERRKRRESRDDAPQETELLKELGLSLDTQSTQRNDTPLEVPEEDPSGRLGKIFFYVTFFVIWSGILGDC